MHRIFFPEELKERIEIKGSKAHKISSVLRMNKEEKLLIFDGKGKSQIMKIDEINKESVSLYAPQKITNKPKNIPEIILAISLIGFHIKHGFQSALKTLGIIQTSKLGLLYQIAFLFWGIIPGMFIIIILSIQFGIIK